ncbi:MAG TPA: hypothetical protein ENI94_02435 [Gammaproteobacteria bacterium]|nr:hypothetical protein [Gammaproteobacteria bacterium]
MMNVCLENAQNNLRIQSVNLKESKVFVRDGIDIPTLDRDETAVQSFRSIVRVEEISLADPEGGEDIWDYRFIYSAGVRLIFSSEKEESANDEYKPIVEIVSVFEAKYLSKSQLKKDEIKAFSADNAGYHVWPYWREYAQSTCARIGLSPAFEVPVYIVSRKDEKSEADKKA